MVRSAVANKEQMWGAVSRQDSAAARAILAADPALLNTFVIGHNWLQLSAQKGNIDLMELFQRAGLGIDSLTEDGTQSALEIAAGQGHYLACVWLLDRGADVNRGFGNEATPIFSAIYSKSAELVRLFAQRGAKLDATFGEPKRGVIEYSEVYGTLEINRFLRDTIGG